MNLPFTQAEFFGVFSSYNTAIWPLQIVFFAAAVLALQGSPALPYKLCCSRTPRALRVSS
jgi:hypothetical protein